MALSIVKEDNRFTVEWQGHFTISLPDTPSNKKALSELMSEYQKKSLDHVTAIGL